MKHKTACYVRVSTEEQTENYSITAQTERLKAYCTAKDWDIYEIYTDGGWSGSHIDRPAMKKMIEDIRAKQITLVLVYKLDRLSRSQKDTLYLIEDVFIKNEIAFVSLQENLDTSTPFGRAMIGILSAFAQLEREQIAERMLMGRTARAKSGKFHGGIYAPIGYRYEKGKLIIDPYEESQIKKIFSLFLKGYSIHKIQTIMHQNYHTKYGDWNNDTAIRNCLSNTVYIGKIKFNAKEYDGEHSPIIEQDIFYTVQTLLQTINQKENSIPPQKPSFKASQLLSGILYCENCSAKFFSDHGNYTCYSRGKPVKKQVTDVRCTMKKWNILMLNTMIQTQINQLHPNVEYFHHLFSTSYIQSTSISELQNRLTEIEKQSNRILDIYLTQTITPEQFTPRMEALKREREYLITQLSSQMVKPSYPSLKEIEIYFKNRNPFIHSTLEEQQMLVRCLIKKIVLGENLIQIYWRFP